MTRLRSIAVTASLGLALTLTVAACGYTPPSSPQAGFKWWPSTPLPTPNEAALNQPSAAPAAASAAPQIGSGQASGLGTAAQTVNSTADLKFSPDTVTVKTGDVVEWDNNSGVAHNVTFDGNDALTSPTLNSGDKWQVKITVAGTYSYHCTFHPGMDGKITVGG